MVDANIFPMIQMKKLKHREAKELAQAHRRVRAVMASQEYAS